MRYVVFFGILGVLGFFCGLVQANTAYLAFDGDFNDAFGVRNGTGENGVGFSPDNPFGDGGQSASFDGVDDRVAISGELIDLRNSYTVSVWVKTDALDVNNVIFAEGFGGIPWFGSRALFIPKGDGRVFYTDSVFGNAVGDTFVADGQWHHIALVVNYDAGRIFQTTNPGAFEGYEGEPDNDPNQQGATVQIYVDGVREAFFFNGNLARLREGLGDLNIGGVPQGDASFPDYDGVDPSNERNHFRGNIDEFRLFNGTATEDQVFDLIGLTSGELPSCAADDTSVGGVVVTPANDGRANVHNVVATGGQDASGDPILYKFTVMRVAGPPREHGQPGVIGPKGDEADTARLFVFVDPDFVLVDTRVAKARPGNEAQVTLWKGSYVISVRVTDQDNLLCQGQDVDGVDDNTALSGMVQAQQLVSGAQFRRSANGNGIQLWFQADRPTSEPPGSQDFWDKQFHAGAFGSQVLTRVPNPDLTGGAVRSQGLGVCGGRLTYEFDISDAGGSAGLYFFWFRQINPFNTSEWMTVEGHPGDLPPFPPDTPGENGNWYGGLRAGHPTAVGCNNPSPFPFNGGDDRILENNTGPGFFWIGGRFGVNGVPPNREGHDKELRDGENAMHMFHRQGSATGLLDVIVVTDDPEYVPSDQDFLNSEPVPDE